jgi:IS30 family transposase
VPRPRKFPRGSPERAKLEEMIRAGVKYIAIGLELNAHHTTVLYHAQRLGIRRRTARVIPWETIDYPELEQMARAGMPYTKIAEWFGVSYTSISRRVRKLGIRRQPSRRKSDDQDSQGVDSGNGGVAVHGRTV